MCINFDYDKDHYDALMHDKKVMKNIYTLQVSNLILIGSTVAFQ